MEYLQLFDDSKNAINEKIDRNNKSNVPKGKHFMIVLLFINNNNGEFLLQRTDVTRNSVIATTGGHVTFGDTPLETVIKECKEELGIDILENEIKYIDTILYNNFYIATFYTKIELDINKLVLQEDEVESINWYTKEEIEKFINNKELREGNIKPYRKVLEYINK